MKKIEIQDKLKFIESKISSFLHYGQTFSYAEMEVRTIERNAYLKLKMETELKIWELEREEKKNLLPF